MAERVRAIEAERSTREGTVLVADRTADDAAAAVDCGSVAMRETPLWPPTVGSQPLVLPGFSEFADGSSGTVRCAVGDVCWVACTGELDAEARVGAGYEVARASTDGRCC